MDEPFNEPVAPSDYGRQRREAWLTRLRANADMASAATMQTHAEGEDRRVTQAGQAGIYGHLSPTDYGATVAARQATVGQDYGQARALERNGGRYDHAAVGYAPAPGRVDLTRIDQQGREPGVSPIVAYMQGRQ